MSEVPVHKLFVTLVRSYAGTKKAQKAILKDLGFSYRLQTLERPNNLHIRGALDKAGILAILSLHLMIILIRLQASLRVVVDATGLV